MNQICSKCKKSKPEIDFNFRCKDKKIRQMQCRKCTNKASKNHYYKNKNSYIKRKRIREKVINILHNQKIYDYLMQNPCVDCGATNPIILEFDHVRGAKTAEVSVLIGRGCCWETIKKEIEKCEIRCSNCHKIKTARERNSWRWRYYSYLEKKPK